VQAPGNISIPITVNPVNDLPFAELILPANGSILSDTSVTFEWKGSDIDNPLADLSYQLNLGAVGEPLVHTSDISGNKFTVSGLDVGKIYYWKIIPTDNNAPGICLNGTWSFSISTNETIPQAVLISPLNNSIVNTTEINLTWDIINLEVGEPIYHIYLGTERDNLTEIARSLEDWHLLSDLEDNTTYYWKVIPVVGALVGRCSGGIWSFAVDTTFEIIYNITLDIDVASIDIIHGKNGIFNITLTNNGNVPTLVEIDFSGKLSGFVNSTKKIILPVGNSSKIPVRIFDTLEITPKNYVLNIEIKYVDTTQNFMIPVNITSREPEISEKEPIKESSGGNWPYFIIGLALLFVILGLGVFFILRKKRKDTGDEEEVVVEADIVKPGESPFSRPQQVTQSPLIQHPPQFAPSVKHSSYMQKTERAVPSAFSVPAQASREEIKDIKSIISDVPPQMAPPTQSPAVPAPPP